MCGKEWTESELQFLKENCPKHTVYWCAVQLGRSRSSVAVKVSSLKLLTKPPRPPKVERNHPDLGPANPPLENRCVDCDRVSRTRRCPKCSANFLSRHDGECWGPTADEAYAVAL